MPLDRRKNRARGHSVLCWVALVTVFLLSAPTFAQEPSEDDEVVRVNTDLVVVNVTVTDGPGKYARGLRRADFTLLEDGREQKLSSFGAEETPFAAAVLLDFSGSMEKRVSMAR